MAETSPIRIRVKSSPDVLSALRAAKEMAGIIGFDDKAIEEISLVAKELATNLIRHAGGGELQFSAISENRINGLQIVSKDRGPGIPSADEALADGYSTGGSLGYGLGTVNRLMDELDIKSSIGLEHGTVIICSKWIRPAALEHFNCPLDIGAATRPHPGMNQNGDAYFIKTWQDGALVGVIDGLGHGQFAHKASQKAFQYLSNHYDRPLPEIFRGVGSNCRATRGVVMALVRFDWVNAMLSFASIGNIEIRAIGGRDKYNFPVRRGILGINAPPPQVSTEKWSRDTMLVLHSDGVASHWSWEEFRHLTDRSATTIARELLNKLGKDHDDATVVVVKSKPERA